MTEATNWERHVTLARGMRAASFMKQDSAERKVRTFADGLSRSFLFLKPGASPGAAHHPTEHHARLLGCECADWQEEPERRDWFQIVGWSLVATGFIYYAWRAFA